MTMRKKITIYGIVCLLTGSLSLWTGYTLSKNPQEDTHDSTLANRSAAVQDETQAPVQSETPIAEAAERIVPSTLMVYEYVYKDGGIQETTQDNSPYFLLDKTEEEISDMFSDWEIVSFTSEKVVLRKTLEEKSGQYYILGIQDGCIAVFYSEPVNGSKLKEVTSTPVSALSAEEQIRLREGINVDGKEELMRLLEDYGS